MEITVPTGSITLKTFPATVTVSPVELAEKVKLADNLSRAEQAQILEWIREKYENITDSIESANELSQALIDALSGKISPDSLQTVLNIIETIFKQS